MKLSNWLKKNWLTVVIGLCLMGIVIASWSVSSSGWSTIKLGEATMGDLLLLAILHATMARSSK